MEYSTLLVMSDDPEIWSTAHLLMMIMIRPGVKRGRFFLFFFSVYEVLKTTENSIDLFKPK